MAKYVNSFSLLDDEEDDDVASLVDRIVKKVDNPLKDAGDEKESSEFVGLRRGGQSRKDGSGGNGYGGNDVVQVGHRRNYSKDSYVNGGTVEDGQFRGEGRGRGQGRGRNYSGENRGYNVNGGTRDDPILGEKIDDGWKDVSRSHGKGPADNGHGYRKNRNENWSDGGDRKGHGAQLQDNNAANAQRKYRSENRVNGSERRSGYGDWVHNNDAASGQRRFSNGNRGYGDEHRGNGDQVQDNGGASGGRRYGDGSQRRGYGENHVGGNDFGSENVNGNGDVYQDTKFSGEERRYGNRDRNYGGDRRGYGGYKGRGTLEYRRTGSGEVKETGNTDYRHGVKADHINGSESDGAMVLEASKAIGIEQNNTSEKVNAVIGDPKQKAKWQKGEELELKKSRSEEWKAKKKEEDDEDAALMTLDQYEKLLLSKRQALESQKMEERRVGIDKDLEGMRLVEKKQDDSDGIWSAKGKLKVVAEVSDDAKLKSEQAKITGSSEKKEKGRKIVSYETHEFFKSAYHRPRSFGGRGQEHGGRGRDGQSHFRDQVNADGPQRNSSGVARVPAHHCIITDNDFPVLGAAPAPAPAAARPRPLSAAVKS